MVLYERNVYTVAVEYGKVNEKMAISKFERQFNLSVQKCGLFIDEIYGFLGASPDGLIENDSLIEVKCLHKVFKSGQSLKEAANEGNMCLTQRENGALMLKRNHDYYYQVPSKKMDVSKTSNTITVENIESNIIVHYSLLIVKGSIHHYACNKDVPLVLTVISQSNNEEKFFTIKPVQNTFKFLLQLNTGDNKIILNYCCAFANFRVQYLRRKSHLNIVPIYIINDGHDGKFQAPHSENNTPENACQRIMTGCKLLQCFIAEKFNEDGLDRKTFQLESDECMIFHSKLGFDHIKKMKQDEIWTHIGRELMISSIGNSDKKYLGFLSCTIYDGEKYSEEISTHEDIVALTDNYIALGSGGLALFGSACLYTWPENIEQVVSRFEDQTIVDKRKFMDDSCYRGTVGACFSTTLGSVLHELCHTLDLGHTIEGIMGRGFDNIYKFFVLSNEDANKKPLGENPNGNVVTKKGNPQTRNGVIRNPQVINKMSKINVVDETYYTNSCSSLMYYHKYLNDYITNRKFVLSYDKSTKLLKSTAGIRVIEIRDSSNEMVLESWTFVGKVLKYSFQLPEECFTDDNFILIVEDNLGNIFKETYTK